MAIRLIAALLATVGGFWLGWRFSRRLGKQAVVVLGLILAIFVGLAVSADSLLPASLILRWQAFEFSDFGLETLLGFCIPIVGVLVAEVITHRAVRLLVLALVGAALFQEVWFGILDALVTRAELSHLKTSFPSPGICKQTTGYTCGPAAAVTALRRLGFAAEEGTLAIAAETGRHYGTDEFRLARTMNETGQGLNCHVADFKSVDELRNRPPVLVIITLEGSLAHYIVVLAFDGKSARVADPLAGDIARMSREALEKNWTGRVIVCDRG